MDKMQVAAVTGASGFIGQAVVSALARAGFAVRAISRQQAPCSLVEGVSWHQIKNFDDNAALSLSLTNAHFVVHLADNPVRTNKRETSNGPELLRALTDAMTRAGVDRLILASSIYARTASETQIYGQSKAAIEAMLKRSSIPSHIVLRLPPVYGPGGRGGFATLSKLVSKGIPLPFRTARAPRDYLSRINLAGLIVAIASADSAAWSKAEGHTFEPSDGKPISTADLILEMAQAQSKVARLIGVNMQLLSLAGSLIGKGALIAGAIDPLQAQGNSALTQIFGWRPQEQIPVSLAYLSH